MKKYLFIVFLPICAMAQQPPAQTMTPPDAGKPIPEFPVYDYQPINRDPFIWWESAVLVKKAAAIDIPQNQETLADLLGKLQKDLSKNCRVVGVYIDDIPKQSLALVDYSPRPIGAEKKVPSTNSISTSGGDQSAAMNAISALLAPKGAPAPMKKKKSASTAEKTAPPMSVNMQDGFPIKAVTGENSYVTRLSAKIAIESGIKLRRDKERGIVYMPIQKITDEGVFLIVPGATSPIMMPCQMDMDTQPEYERPSQPAENNKGGLLQRLLQ